MSRRKAQKPWLRGTNLGPAHDPSSGDVEIPILERSVHKRVPAVVHWDQVEGNDRTDDEVIGEAIIYDDGTSDVIVFNEISEDAKGLVQIINGRLDYFSIEN